MIRGLLLAVFAMTLLSTPVFAGGNGGSKKDATVKLTNNTTNTYLVIANPSAAFIAKVTAGTASLQDFQTAGGQVVLAGNSATLKIKAGSNSVYATPVVNNVPGTPKLKTITATKGQTVNVNISTF